MIFDVKTLATVNLIIQALLLVTVLVAVYFARKRQIDTHCKIVRIAVVIQLVSIFLIMLPLMLGYVKNPKPLPFQTEMLVHHSLGAIIILQWVYINLAFMGRLKVLGRLTIFMRCALVMWVLVFLLGLYLYLQNYVLL